MFPPKPPRKLSRSPTRSSLLPRNGSIASYALSSHNPSCPTKSFCLHSRYGLTMNGGARVLTRRLETRARNIRKPMQTNPTIQLTLTCLICLQVALAGSSFAADMAHAKDGSGVYGYKDTPKLPWCQWLV